MTEPIQDNLKSYLKIYYYQEENVVIPAPLLRLGQVEISSFLLETYALYVTGVHPKY